VELCAGDGTAEVLLGRETPQRGEIEMTEKQKQN
jgi:hypothetical protein